MIASRVKPLVVRWSRTAVAFALLSAVACGSAESPRRDPVPPADPVLVGSPTGQRRCASEPDRMAEQLAGMVIKGQPFSLSTTGDWIVRLDPDEEGWFLRIAMKGREDEDLSRLTPPWHFVPNPREISGWHFRNVDNTGPNDSSVNAPGELREFIFSPLVGRGIEYKGSATSAADVERVQSFGRGWLHVDQFRLTPVAQGQRAAFEWLEFTVCLTWPREGDGASQAAGQPMPAELEALAARVKLEGTVSAWCRADFRGAIRSDFALAEVSTSRRRYLALDTDGRVTELGAFSGRPDLSCYTRADAEKLNRSIGQSQTIHGQIAPRWNTTVVCGFTDDTAAECWQYSPADRAFVKVGGWMT